MANENSCRYGSLEEQVLIFLRETIRCVKARQNPLANALLDAQPEGLRGVMLRDKVWIELAIVLNHPAKIGGHIIEFDNKNPTTKDVKILLAKVYKKVATSKKNGNGQANGFGDKGLRLFT